MKAQGVILAVIHTATGAACCEGRGYGSDQVFSILFETAFA